MSRQRCRSQRVEGSENPGREEDIGTGRRQAHARERERDGCGWMDGLAGWMDCWLLALADDIAVPFYYYFIFNLSGYYSYLASLSHTYIGASVNNSEQKSKERLIDHYCCYYKAAPFQGRSDSHIQSHEGQRTVEEQHIKNKKSDHVVLTVQRPNKPTKQSR